MPEELFQILQVESRCDPEHPPTVKDGIAAKNVQMRMIAVWEQYLRPSRALSCPLVPLLVPL
jgi:hypothetical protein